MKFRIRQKRATKWLRPCGAVAAKRHEHSIAFTIEGALQILFMPGNLAQPLKIMGQAHCVNGTRKLMGWTRPLILSTGRKLQRGGQVMITVIGLDLAKNVFQVHGVDEHGKTVLSKKLARAKVLTFFANQPPCLVGMEACGGSHFWAREIAKFGHKVKQMPPQFVKPYVKTNKTDARDAEAICEAVTRPGMRFVPTKSIEQQDVLALHRIRERHVAARTAVANQARGLLLELGVVIPQGIRKLRTQLPLICEDLENSLTTIERSYLYDLYAELAEKDDKIIQYDHILANICKNSEQCRLLMSIPGIGILGATAIVASIGDGKEFSNGRQLAAWLGLVPKQHSSGGKTRMQGISKRGDAYLRRLLIHGSRAVVKYSFRKTDGQSTWLNDVISRRGTHKAIAAQANKTARIIWAVLTKGAPFQAAA